jgi:enamine deaminase RidA (YjgF/YER057c/UK114 family)
MLPPFSNCRAALRRSRSSAPREFGRAHAEAFGDHPPATTMVEVSSLIDQAMLLEVEADAVVDD